MTIAIRRRINALLLAGLLLALPLSLARATVTSGPVPRDELRAQIQSVLYWEAVCAPRQPLLGEVVKCVEPRDGWVPMNQRDDWDAILEYLDG